MCARLRSGRAARRLRMSLSGFWLHHGLRGGCAAPETEAVAGATPLFRCLAWHLRRLGCARHPTLRGGRSEAVIPCGKANGRADSVRPGPLLRPCLSARRPAVGRTNRWRWFPIVALPATIGLKLTLGRMRAGSVPHRFPRSAATVHSFLLRRSPSCRHRTATALRRRLSVRPNGPFPTTSERVFCTESPTSMSDWTFTTPKILLSPH